MKLGNVSPASLLTALPTQLLSKHLVIPAVSSQMGTGETYLSNECRAASQEPCGPYFFHVTFSYDSGQTVFQLLFLESKKDPLFKLTHWG